MKGHGLESYIKLKGTLSDYLCRAFVVLLLYDHTLTFDLEMERIWTLEWRLPKFLFLVNRYVAPVLILTLHIAKSTHSSTPTAGLLNVQNHNRLFVYLCLWIRILPLLTAELVLVIRVSALYGHNKIMLRFLTMLWAGQGISVIALSGVLRRDFRGGSSSGIKCSILLDDTHIPLPNNISAYVVETWIPYVIFDGVIIILTVYKVLSYRDHMNPTVRLLARDSIVYFIIMFCTFLFNALGTTIHDVIVSVPAECVACIAVARMMMNIRGLVFDDPYGSQEMKLPTIEFRVAPKASVHSENGKDIDV